jgi:hypothetical protein
MTEQADSSFSKPNLGAGLFGPMSLLAARPSPAALGRRRQQLLDLAGDGQLDLDQFDGPVADASSCSLTNRGSADAPVTCDVWVASLVRGTA